MMKARLIMDRRRALALGAATLAAGVAPRAWAQTDSLARIRERGYLLYGFNGERPYNYMDADGTLTGSEIDIARAVAAKIGIEEVQGVAMNFDSFIPAIMAGRIDTCLPIFIRPARCERIAYARPHLIEGQSAMVPAGNPKNITGWDDLVQRDINVGLIAGTTPNEIASSAGVPEGNITRFPDTVTLAAGLRAGRVDVIVEASSTLRLIYEDMDQSAFDRVSGWSKPTDYEGSITFYAAFPFAQGAGELRDEFDAALAGMLESGELQEIAAPYGFGPTDRPGPDSPTLEQLCTG